MIQNLKARVAWGFVDDYNVELVNPDQSISEKELENTIVENIVKFLQDIGGSFAFVGRQYRLEYDEKEYMLDETRQPIGVATFNQYKNLPKNIAKYLPSEAEIIKRLGNLTDDRINNDKFII